MLFTKQKDVIDKRIIDLLCSVPDDLVELYVKLFETLETPITGNFLDNIVSLSKELQLKRYNLLKSKHINSFDIFPDKKIADVKATKIKKEKNGILLCYIIVNDGLFSFFIPRIMFTQSRVDTIECKNTLKKISNAYGKDILITCLDRDIVSVKYLKFEIVNIEKISKLMNIKNEIKKFETPIEFYNFIIKTLFTQDNFEGLLSVYLNRSF